MKKIILVISLLCMALSACSSEEVYTHMVGSAIESMDPTKTQGESSFLLLSDIYVGLMRVDGDNNLVKSGARDIEVSDDGLVYTLFLREDINWVDNTGAIMAPVTANDYVFGYQRMVDPTVGSVYSYIFENIENASPIITGDMQVEKLGVKAIDDYTLEITLSQATPYFTNLLAFGSYVAQPQAAVIKYGDEYGTSAKTTWYDGAYYVTDYDPDYIVSMTKNPNYYNADKVEVERIDYRLNTDDAARYNAFVNGDANYTKIETLENYKSGKEAGIIDEQTTLFSEYLVLSVSEDAHTSNRNLRKALALGVDRDSIVNSLYEGMNFPIEYIVPANLTVASYDGLEYRDVAGNSMITFNEQMANTYFDKYMDDMGYTKRSQIEVDYLLNSEKDDADLAEVLQAYYKEKYGITINIVSTAGGDYIEKRKSGAFDMLATQWAPDYGDPSTYLALWKATNIGSQNYAQYNNPKYDQLYEKADSLQDPQQRFKYFAKCEQLLIDDAIIVPMFQKKAPYLLDPEYNYPECVIFLVSHEYLTKNE